MNFKKIAVTAALGGALTMGSVVTSNAANFLDNFLAPGVINTFNDNSLEAYVDANGSNAFDAGDVIVGIVRIENRTAPSNIAVNNSTYVVFSNQIQSLNNANGQLVFQPTTVVGLRMSDLVAGAQANALVAVITNSGGFSGTDITAVTPPNQPGGTAGITMYDYIRFLTNNGQVALIAGISDAPGVGDIGDFFHAQLTSTAPSLADIVSSPGTVTFASFAAGLSILTNNTSFNYLDALPSNSVFFNGGGTLSEFSVSSGTVRGANGTSPNEFLNILGLSNLEQCGTAANTDGAIPCGFINNADFNVLPVPEPASMILFGLGLAGLGAYGRRRNRK